MPDAQPAETQNQQTEHPETTIQFEVETAAQPGRVSAWSHLWKAGGIVHRPLTVRQKFWRVGGLLLTLTLVMAVLFGQQIGSFAANTWSAVHRPSVAETTCLVDGAWSQSGARLAILGYQGQCGAPGRLAGVLNIYDGAGRLRLRQVALDPLLAPAEKTLARAVNTDKIALGQLTWFKGEKQLALTFTLPPRSDLGETVTQFGILVLDPANAAIHPIVRFYEIPNRPGSAYPLPDTGVIWDLNTGQNIMLSGKSTFEFWDNPLPLAYQYAWSAARAGIPLAAETADNQATRPVGNPQGDTSFQLWQSGWLAPLQQQAAPFPGTGDAQALFQTTFAAASPDGRYVIAPLVMQTPVSPRIAGPGAPQPDASDTPPILLARDAAFAQILRAAGKYPHQTQRPAIPVAWRPDGKAVATFNLDNDQKVNIYECATGKLLASVAEPAQPTQFAGILGALRWSPDGRHLLLLDGAILTV